MGDATIDVKPYIECMQMGLEELPLGTAVKKLQPSANNCLADESKVTWIGKGKMVQDMILKLQNVERGKVQIQLEWLDIPGCKGLHL
ncbi:Protein C2-DOMAIN ABA-RELATED 4 [Bienertia sinuspersici]